MYKNELHELKLKAQTALLEKYTLFIMKIEEFVKTNTSLSYLNNTEHFLHIEDKVRIVVDDFISIVVTITNETVQVADLIDSRDQSLIFTFIFTHSQVQ